MSFTQAAERIELESTPLQEARLRIAHESKQYFRFHLYWCIISFTLWKFKL